MVLGSDGLFDNLFPNEIAEIVSHANQKHTSLFTQWMRPALSVKATSELLKERVFVASQVVICCAPVPLGWSKTPDQWYVPKNFLQRTPGFPKTQNPFLGCGEYILGSGWVARLGVDGYIWGGFFGVF